MSNSVILTWTESVSDLLEIIWSTQDSQKLEFDKLDFSINLWPVTQKILDMKIAFMLPDGSEYTPFTTVEEVDKVFHTLASDLLKRSNRNIIDVLLSRFYREKIQPKEVEILDSQREFVQDFFRQNVWWMVDDSDTIDTLISEIRALADMGIIWINTYICEDTIGWIIMNILWTRKTLSDWENITFDERKNFIVGDLDKEIFTNYFADLVVLDAWQKYPNSPIKLMNEVVRKIRGFIIIDTF